MKHTWVFPATTRAMKPPELLSFLRGTMNQVKVEGEKLSPAK